MISLINESSQTQKGAMPLKTRGPPPGSNKVKLLYQVRENNKLRKNTGSESRKENNDRLRLERREMRARNKVLDELLWSTPPFRPFTSLNSLCKNPMLPAEEQSNSALERIRRFDELSMNKNKIYLVPKSQKCSGKCVTFDEIVNHKHKSTSLKHVEENEVEISENRISCPSICEDSGKNTVFSKAAIKPQKEELDGNSKSSMGNSTTKSKYVPGVVSDSTIIMQLVNLSWNNRLEPVKELVRKHFYSIDVNHLCYKGYNALHAAGQNCNIAIMKFLVHCGASPFILSTNGKTFFEMVSGGIAATNYKHRHHRKGLIKQALAIASTTSIFEASLNGDVGRVKWLLDSKDNNVHVDDTNAYGMTALHYAFLGKNRDVVEILLQHGADVSHKNSIYQTPLDLAEERDIIWMKKNYPKQTKFYVI